MPLAATLTACRYTPVLFVIYLSELFGEVERKEEESESEGISFVDDEAWVVEGMEWGNAHNDWKDAPLEHKYRRRKMPVSLT
jgi:hypothetical protein